MKDWTWNGFSIDQQRSLGEDQSSGRCRQKVERTESRKVEGISFSIYYLYSLD